MKAIYLMVFLVAAFVLSSCTKEAVPTDISKICAADNEKKYVITSGYLDDRGSIFCSNIGGGSVRCGLDVIASPGEKKAFGADIVEGSGVSEIEKLPSGYKASDIKVHDNSGTVIQMSDKVKLTGQMSRVPDGSVCIMTVDNIEK